MESQFDDQTQDLVTAEGYARLQSQHCSLTEQLKVANAAIGEAAGDNRDGHDNHAYEAALQEVALLSTRLHRLEKRMENVRVVEQPDAGSGVRIGHEVTVEIEGDIETYVIGGDGDRDGSRN